MAAKIHIARQAKVDLENEIHGLKTEARKLLGVAARTPVQEARLAAIEADVETKSADLGEVLADVSRLERAQEIERASAPGGAHPGAGGMPARGRRFADMFPNADASLNGFDTGEGFLSAVHSGRTDDRLIADFAPATLRGAMTTTVPSDGGFAVPAPLFGTWLDASLEHEIVRPRATIYPMTAPTIRVPGWDDGTRAGGVLFGGFSGQWVAEGGTVTAEAPRLRLIELSARKLAILASVSNELIADGINFEVQLGGAITKAMGYFMDSAFLSANGASAPQGIIGASCTISVAKETSQTAATINYVNIAKMFSRLTPQSFSNPSTVWVVNASAIPQLLQLSITIGSTGAHVPVLNQQNGTWNMLGLPVVFSDKCAALGTVGDIVLADFSQYAIGLRAEFTLSKSAHAGFASDTSYYRGIIRVDGQPILSAPITPKNGDTQSPFVTLATRA